MIKAQVNRGTDDLNRIEFLGFVFYGDLNRNCTLGRDSAIHRCFSPLNDPITSETFKLHWEMTQTLFCDSNGNGWSLRDISNGEVVQLI